MEKMTEELREMGNLYCLLRQAALKPKTKITSLPYSEKKKKGKKFLN